MPFGKTNKKSGGHINLYEKGSFASNALSSIRNQAMEERKKRKARASGRGRAGRVRRQYVRLLNRDIRKNKK